MKNIPAFYRSFAEHLEASAHVKTIFGEPINTETKTIVPVAKIAYGFGGGPAKGDPEKGPVETAGGGGGIAATPLGVIEVTNEKTRFIPTNEFDWQAGLALFSLGFLLAWNLKPGNWSKKSPSWL